MSGNQREWMYKRYEDGYLSEDFLVGLEGFIMFALDRPEFLDGEKIKCPCIKCKNQQYLNQYTVRLHIAKFGFVPNYYNWIHQGERRAVKVNHEQNFDHGCGSNANHEMIRDVGASQCRSHRKNRDYTSARSKRTTEKVYRVAHKRSELQDSNEEQQEIGMNAKYIEVAKENSSKGRMLGLGDGGSAVSSAIDTEAMAQHLSSLQTELQEERTKRVRIMEQMQVEREERKQLEERMYRQAAKQAAEHGEQAAELARIKEQLDMIMQQFMRSGPPPS